MSLKLARYVTCRNAAIWSRLDEQGHRVDIVDRSKIDLEQTSSLAPSARFCSRRSHLNRKPSSRFAPKGAFGSRCRDPTPHPLIASVRRIVVGSNPMPADQDGASPNGY
jgi:hypothetical protein